MGASNLHTLASCVEQIEFFKEQPRILLADDSPEALMIMSRILSKKGVDVTQVSNGQDALDAFINSDFDLILLDHKMPDKTGLEVLETIRKHRSPEEQAVIIITGSQDKDVVKAAIGLQVNDFFVKPIRAGIFFQRILRHLIRFSDEEVRDCLSHLNVSDSTGLPPEIRASLQAENLVAYPFQKENISCFAIVEKGKNPHFIAKNSDETKLESEVTVLGKGGFLWNVVYPDHPYHNLRSQAAPLKGSPNEIYYKIE